MKKLINFLFLLLLLSACRVPIYRPTDVEIPMVKNAGDIEATGKASLAGTQGTTSIAVHKNILLTGSIFKLKTSSEQNLRGKGYSIGIGSFYKINDSKTYKSTISLIGGYGEGNYVQSNEKLSTKWFFDPIIPTFYFTTTTKKHTYSKIYLQPNITLSMSDIADIGFGIRYNYMRYRYNEIYTDYSDSYSHNELIHLNCLDFATTFQLGYKYFKLYGQIGFSSVLNPPKNIDLYFYQNLMLSFGANVNLNVKDLKRKSKSTAKQF